MKRIVPPELHKMYAWLLSEKRFDDMSVLSRVVNAMENSTRISFDDSLKFTRLLQEYRRRERSQGFF